MPDSTVVNLLDMRDDEEANAGGRDGGGGRWAGRNPKAKAKAGGRNRRARHRGGDEEGGRRSGFGGRQRLNSQASNVSDYSDYDEEEDAQAKPSNASAPRTDPPGQEQAEGGSKNELFSKLQSEEPKTKLTASQDVTKAMVQGHADLEYGAGTPATVSDGGGEVFSEARMIAKYRALLQNEKPGLTGPHFKQSVWEYYMVKGSFSDKMCVALDHMSMLPFCLVPCLWPCRLCRTMQRSAPIKIKMCKCCNCTFAPCCACPISTFIFIFPILAVLLFFPQLGAGELIKQLLLQIPNVPSDPTQLDNLVLAVSIVLCCFFVFLWVFWWARVLLGVGMKYSIVEAVDKPDKFACKTMGCIVCMNSRVGAHVDRAQGFAKALKADNTVIELSDTMRMVNPQQNIMV